MTKGASQGMGQRQGAVKVISHQMGKVELKNVSHWHKYIDCNLLPMLANQIPHLNCRHNYPICPDMYSLVKCTFKNL